MSIREQFERTAENAWGFANRDPREGRWEFTANTLGGMRTAFVLCKEFDLADDADSLCQLAQQRADRARHP